MALLARGGLRGQLASAGDRLLGFGDPAVNLQGAGKARLRQRKALVGGECAAEGVLTAGIGRQHQVDAGDISVARGGRGG